VEHRLLPAQAAAAAAGASAAAAEVKKHRRTGGSPSCRRGARVRRCAPPAPAARRGARAAPAAHTPQRDRAHAARLPAPQSAQRTAPLKGGHSVSGTRVNPSFRSAAPASGTSASSCRKLSCAAMASARALRGAAAGGWWMGLPSGAGGADLKRNGTSCVRPKARMQRHPRAGRSLLAASRRAPARRAGAFRTQPHAPAPAAPRAARSSGAEQPRAAETTKAHSPSVRGAAV
jgi:hypothetical protein